MKYYVKVSYSFKIEGGDQRLHIGCVSGMPIFPSCPLPLIAQGLSSVF